jgi:hypothetical protein
MKKLVVVLMLIVSMLIFADQSFKQAMNDERVGPVSITAVIRVHDDVWKYIVTDGSWIGFLDIEPNDINVIMKTDDPTALPGVGKRNLDGWVDKYKVENWLYEEAARGRYHEAILLKDYRTQIRNRGAKNVQKSRL